MPDMIVRRQDAVFEIILNRPEIRNAVNREAIGELAAAVAEAAEDRIARAVLLRGAGTHFCAGGDITMFGELLGLSPEERGKAFHEIVSRLHPLLTRMRHMPKPVVAAVQGAAAGFGLSLVPRRRSGTCGRRYCVHVGLHSSRHESRRRDDDDVTPHRGTEAGLRTDVSR
jgi:2-(1,2-epoxy-1,2-dihydrophenyl)acetyl-CoA isomerase